MIGAPSGIAWGDAFGFQGYIANPVPLVRLGPVSSSAVVRRYGPATRFAALVATRESTYTASTRNGGLMNRRSPPRLAACGHHPPGERVATRWEMVPMAKSSQIHLRRLVANIHHRHVEQEESARAEVYKRAAARALEDPQLELVCVSVGGREQHLSPWCSGFPERYAENAKQDVHSRRRMLCQVVDGSTSSSDLRAENPALYRLLRTHVGVASEGIAEEELGSNLIRDEDGRAIGVRPSLWEFVFQRICSEIDIPADPRGA